MARLAGHRRADRARVSIPVCACPRILRGEGFSHVLLLGMGGSSLGPEVLAETFGRQNGHPGIAGARFDRPAQIRTIESRIDPARTLFIVSSKSGTHARAQYLQAVFLRAREASGRRRRGGIAVHRHHRSRVEAAEASPSTIDSARSRLGMPSIGGRYSVLSDFGMVPAAVMGLDVAQIAGRGAARWCARARPTCRRPTIPASCSARSWACSAKPGRDKVTIVASPGIADFGAWLEQLLAESTGKHGKGLIPVDAEPLGPPAVYGNDRLFVYVRLSGEADPTQDGAVAALERAGHPVVRIAVSDRYHIGQEFFRWEIATAVAGSILGINPFDQPDVEASKIKTRRADRRPTRRAARCRPKTPLLERAALTLFADERNSDALGQARARSPNTSGAFRHSSRRATIARSSPMSNATSAIATRCRKSASLIRDRKRVATCLGFGPRFLHSTGQAYKGGPNTGVFLQITCDDAADLAGARPEIHLRRRQGGAGARRFRGAGRTRPARAARRISARMSRRA